MGRLAVPCEVDPLHGAARAQRAREDLSALVADPLPEDAHVAPAPPHLEHRALDRLAPHGLSRGPAASANHARRPCDFNNQRPNAPHPPALRATAAGAIGPHGEDLRGGARGLELRAERAVALCDRRAELLHPRHLRLRDAARSSSASPLPPVLSGHVSSLPPY
jgi:hypothetical protein